MRRLAVIVVAVLAVGGLSGVAAYENSRSQVPDWREIAWPLPRDGWPAGRAFRCGAASCGDEIELYVRPKIGFCNCDRGVTDDDEVDRVADLDLLSERFVPLAAGEAIRVAEMPGRSRTYALRMPDGVQHGAVGIAVSRRCDLLVAVAQGKSAAAVVQQATMKFLATDSMKQWMISAMDGR
jgi:hypothetical protein